MSIYISIIYIIFFGDFEAYSIIFMPFGFNTGELGLAFIPVAVGLCITTLFVPWWYQRFQRITRQVQQKQKEDGDKNWEKAMPPPEERLTIAMCGTFLIPIALFYQAWTSYPTLPPWPCLSAGFLFGAGILCVFISTYMYLIDVYRVSRDFQRGDKYGASLIILLLSGRICHCSRCSHPNEIRCIRWCCHVHTYVSTEVECITSTHIDPPPRRLQLQCITS